MDSKLIMENYLLILKSTMEVYVHGTLESSNKDVRDTLRTSLEETLTHQANTYDLMTKYGWYTINNVEISTINETLNKVNNS